MNEPLHLDELGRLRDGHGRIYDPAGQGWRSDDGDGRRVALQSPSGRPAPGALLSPVAAVTWLQTRSGHPLRVPVGVIGPRDATATQWASARAIGVGLGQMGLAVVCGGRHGVMEAVALGVREAGGISIGILPDATPAPANPHLSFVLATGLGEARNAVIARSAFALIAIGDSYGTLSEVALGLQFGKRVFGLDGAARVDGVEHHDGADAVLAALALHLLA